MLLPYGPASAAAAWRSTPYRYPGPRPDFSFAITEAGVHPILAAAGAGTREDQIDLDGRHPVLAYGSNADPSKISDRLIGPGAQAVVALRARIHDWSAAWASGRRARDHSPVAVLLPRPGHTASTHVLWVTDEQLERIDDWEGHPDRYRRQQIKTGVEYVDLADGPSGPGGLTAHLFAYLGVSPARQALRDDSGNPYWLDEHPVEQIDAILP